MIFITILQKYKTKKISKQVKKYFNKFGLRSEFVSAILGCVQFVKVAIFQATRIFPLLNLHSAYKNENFRFP